MSELLAQCSYRTFAANHQPELLQHRRYLNSNKLNKNQYKRNPLLSFKCLTPMQLKLNSILCLTVVSHLK